MFLILKIKHDKVCYIINTLFLDERENLNFKCLLTFAVNVDLKVKEMSLLLEENNSRRCTLTTSMVCVHKVVYWSIVRYCIRIRGGYWSISWSVSESRRL